MSVQIDEASGRACHRMQEDAVAYVERTRPALVLVIENSAWARRLSSGAVDEAATLEWRAGV